MKDNNLDNNILQDCRNNIKKIIDKVVWQGGR